MVSTEIHKNTPDKQKVTW